MNAAVVIAVSMLSMPAWAEPVHDDPIAVEEAINVMEDRAGQDTDVTVQTLRERVREQQRQLADMQGQLEAIAVTPPTAPKAEDRVTFGEVAVVQAGEVVADVAAFGADVRIEGTVTGDATAFGGDIVLLRGAMLQGDALSFGGRVVSDPNSQIMGKRLTMAMPLGGDWSASVSDPERTQGALITDSASTMLSRIYQHLILFLSFAGAGVLVVGLFPDRVSRIAEEVEMTPIRAAFTGVFAGTALTLGSLLFAITVVGLPVSFLLMAMLGLAWLMGFVGLCQALGDRLPFERPNHGRWVAFLVGIAIVTGLGALPWIGWLVVFATGAMGVGAAVSSGFGGRQLA